MFPLLLLSLACGDKAGDSGAAADSGATGTDSGEYTLDPVDPLEWDPTTRGEFNVGFTSFEHTYEPLPGESRTILVNIWYPTTDTDGAPVTYSGFFAAADDILGDATPAALPPAEPWPGGFPLHLYSHGDQAFGGSSAFLMAWYASHGWVAAAPDHTDNLLIENVTPTPQGHWYHRPKDVMAVADVLGDLPADHPLHGMIDTSHYVLSGHSRGTSTVWSLAGATYDMDQASDFCPDCSADQLALFSGGALADDRVVAAMPLAGGLRGSLFGDDAVAATAGVDVPVLYMTGTADSGDPEALMAALEGAPVDIAWLSLEGGCHQTFALGTCDTLDTDRGFTIVGSYALAQGRATLLGDDDPTVQGILDGSIEVDEAATYQR